MSSSMGFSDAVTTAVNPDPDAPPTDQPPPLPPRPADTATARTWRKYVVALGAHPDSLADIDVAELIEMADRFGG